MLTAEIGFEQVLGTVDKLSSIELELLQERIVQSRQKKTPPVFRGYPDEARELFAISFDTYMAMPDDERDAIAFRAYKILDRWIDRELKARHAKWMLVSGGEILESSPQSSEYPSREKLMKIGKDRGRIPFVFISTPLIEESSWSALDNSDHYPTLPITVARFGANKDVLISDERGQVKTKQLDAVFVRNWRQSPLCLVNPDREALAGRNLLLEFPLRVVLDGERKKTEILDKKPAAKKPQKHN